MLFILSNDKSKRSQSKQPVTRLITGNSNPVHSLIRTITHFLALIPAQFLCFSSTNHSTNLSYIKASICKHKRTQKKAEFTNKKLSKQPTISTHQNIDIHTTSKIKFAQTIHNSKPNIMTQYPQFIRDKMTTVTNITVRNSKQTTHNQSASNRTKTDATIQQHRP